jgi:hypothetical protein
MQCHKANDSKCLGLSVRQSEKKAGSPRMPYVSPANHNGFRGGDEAQCTYVLFSCILLRQKGVPAEWSDLYFQSCC